jgi:hypothetical protein
MNPNQKLQKALMEQLERLNSPDMVNPIKLEREVARANALTQVGNTLINSAKAEVAFLKQVGGTESNFFSKSIEGPEQKALPTPTDLLIEYAESEDVETTTTKKTQAQERAERMDKQLLDDKPVIKGDDLKGKIPLKLDAKTTIFIKPTDDPEAVRAKYENRNNNPQQ